MAAFRKVKGNIERLFDKNLTDLVRGLRNNKDNEGRYIAQCMEEIKQELKQDNISVKTNAISKLCYLQMMGYDINWAAFNIIEVMSSTKFTYKRIGYLAASQCFNENTEVLMLTTNMIRKDLNSQNTYDAGTALTGLSCFITTDLARDLANDVVTLLTSTKPYIKKKAVLLLYKIFLNYPDALKPTFPRLKERLEDTDPGVQSAAVNVICELARKNPKNYLSLAPIFFKLMTSSSNNWMLIKIIKLFGALTPLEPRLGKKLIEPLTNLINSTSAMSLLYECINTVIAVLISVSSGVPGDHTASIQLCVQKLSVLIEDTDQNLKYLGLLAMGRILTTHPKAVQAHKDLVMNCLDDRDESIRLRALDLLYGMVSKKNIMEIVKKLMIHVEGAEGSTYRDELLAKIIQICSHNNYQYIGNFEWYVSVLVELTRVEGTRHGHYIAQQMLDVAVRVQSIRHFAVSQMALLIENSHVLLNSIQRSNISEVLYAAAWIVGEYSEHLRNRQAVLESMLRTKVSIMPGHIQSVFVQNIGKLYSELAAEAEAKDDWDYIESLDNLLVSKLPQYELSENIEVQERACSLIQLMKEIERLHKRNEKVGDELALLFHGELNPIAPKAQRKVPVPEGLDLDAWINEPLLESPPSETEAEATTSNLFVSVSQQAAIQEKLQKRYEPTEEELQKVREQRRAEQATNPHYLKGTAPKQRPADLKVKKLSSREQSFPDMALTSPELQTPLEIPGIVGLDKYMERQEQTISWKNVKKGKQAKEKATGKRKKKGKAAVSSSDEEIPVIHEINREYGEMPENAKSTDEDEPKAEKQDIYKALDINLDEPLRDNERLPVRTHRIASPQDSPLKAATKGTPSEQQNAKIEAATSEVKKKKNGAKSEKEGKKVAESGKTKKAKKATTKVSGKKSVENSLLISPEESAIVETPRKSGAAEANTVGGSVGQAAKNDLDFWLSDAASSAQDTTATTGGVAHAGDIPSDSLRPTAGKPAKEPLHKKHSGKKPATAEKETVAEGRSRKKSKSSDGGGKEKKSRKGEKKETKLAVPDRSEYEEASGLCTPTNEQRSSSETPSAQLPSPTPPAIPDLSRVVLLAENDFLKLTYETQVSTFDAHQVAVKVVFTALSEFGIKQLEFSVLDSLNAKLIKKSGTQMDSGVQLPFTLSGQAACEERTFLFAVEAINVPQKLRGTLSYMRVTASGSIPEKLDFFLRFPVLTFMHPVTLSSQAFGELLANGVLEHKRSVAIQTSDSFQTVLTKLSFLAHLSVIEQLGDTASLYGQNIQAQPLCLLVKQKNESLSIDGKSSDSQLLNYGLDELKDLLA